MIDFSFWTNLLVNGFFVGALIGAIIGVITWVVTEKGTNVIFVLSVAFIIGLIVGVYMEGGAVLRALSGGPEALLESTEAIRLTLFNSTVGIMHWLFAALALGAAVASLRRAVMGALLGGIIGTLSGMVMILLNTNLKFSLSNPLTEVLIALTCMLLLTIMALNQAE